MNSYNAYKFNNAKNSAAKSGAGLKMIITDKTGATCRKLAYDTPKLEPISSPALR